MGEWELCASSGVVQLVATGGTSVDVTWAGTYTALDVALLDVEKYRMHCIFATASGQIRLANGESVVAKVISSTQRAEGRG